MNKSVSLSFNISVGIHAVVFGFYFYLLSHVPKTSLTTISNVDILVPERAKPMVRVEKSAKPPTTWNFLKMALPQVPASQVASPVISKEERRIQMPEPLKENEGRLESKSQLKQISISQKSQALAEAAAKNISVREQNQIPAGASLDLEEIGSRRAPNLPSDITLENSGMPSFKPQNLREVKAFVAVQRSRPVGPSDPLAPEAQDSATVGRSRQGKIGQLFSGSNLQIHEGSAGRSRPVLAHPKIEAVVSSSKASQQKKEILQVVEENKAAQIAGPLSQRKIIRYYIPSFPDWAKEQRILEATVSIRFYVSRDGRVMSDLSVERSSGYGTLDRLAMETLKKWLFAPSNTGSDREWGIITFKYFLE